MFDMLMDNLEGLLAIKAFFPLYCMSTRKTFVTLRISDTFFECYLMRNLELLLWSKLLAGMKIP